MKFVRREPCPGFAACPYSERIRTVFGLYSDRIWTNITNNKKIKRKKEKRKRKDKD